MNKKTLPFKFSVFALFLAGASIRVFGLWFPSVVPDEFHFHDGAQLVLQAWRFLAAGDLVRASQINLVTINGVFGKYLSAVSILIAQIFSGDLSTQLSSIPWSYFVLRFAVSVVPSVLNLFIVFRIAEALDISKTFSAFVLLASVCAFQDVAWAHIAVSDSLATCLSSACLLFLVQWSSSSDPQQNKFTWSVVLAALAASTKIHVGIVDLATIFACIWLRDFRNSNLRKQFQNTVLAGTVFSLVFGIVNVSYFIHGHYWWSLLHAHLFEVPYNVLGGWLIYFYFVPSFGVGWSSLAMASLGILVLLQQTEKEKSARKRIQPLLVFGILFFVYLSLLRMAVDRWMIPLTPVISILVGFGVEFIWQVLRRVCGHLGGVALGTIFLLFLFAPPFVNILLWDLNLLEQPVVSERVHQFLLSAGGTKRCMTIGYRAMGAPRGYFSDCPSETPSPESLSNAPVDYVLLPEQNFYFEKLPQAYIPAQNQERHTQMSEIKKFVQEHWEFVRCVRPDWYTIWGFEIPKQHQVAIYRRPDSSAGVATTPHSIPDIARECELRR